MRVVTRWALGGIVSAAAVFFVFKFGGELPSKSLASQVASDYIVETVTEEVATIVLSAVLAVEESDARELFDAATKRLSLAEDAPLYGATAYLVYRTVKECAGEQRVGPACLQAARNTIQFGKTFGSEQLPWELVQGELEFRPFCVPLREAGADAALVAYASMQATATQERLYRAWVAAKCSEKERRADNEWARVLGAPQAAQGFEN